jgi:hypothetical protein
MSARIDIRIDGQPVVFHDDAAALIHLIALLPTDEDIDRVLLAAEGIKNQRADAGTWNVPADWSEFAASVRERLCTVAL